MDDITVGKILLKSYLPKSLHHHLENAMDKKGINNLFSDLSKNHKEEFNHITSHLARFGFEAATKEGSSVSLEDLKSPIDKDKRFDELEDKIHDVKKEKLGSEKENEEILKLYGSFTDKMDKDIISEGLKHNKTLAKIVNAGTRGSVSQYRSTVAAPGLVLDAKEKPFLDFPIKHSFSEGLSLPEYLASSHGARIGEISKKMSVASSGFLSKQLSRSSTTIIVKEHDCGTNNGVSYSVSDGDSIGCFLAHPVDSYKKNNEITSDMLIKLKQKNITSVVVRSPMTCESSKHFHSGSVCQLCIGMRENGLPQLGAYIGILAAASSSEPLTQLTLSKKHSSGTASGATVGGFDLINQLANIPKNFPEAAAIADSDGEISDIKKAGSGGNYIKLNNVEHYVGPGFNIHVKKGDMVEKGDVLSEGVIDPSKIVEYKGIGEGRKHYVDAMYKAFKDSGIPVNRRNFEIIAKNAIDHVVIDDPEGLGDYLPDQIVSYQALEKNYKPREDSKLVRIDHAKGQFLESPVLHYTIGTPINNTVIKNLKQNNIESVTVHHSPPNFHPEMIRLLDIPEHEQDWAHQLYSTYLHKRLTHVVNTGDGASSDLKGPSPILGLSVGVGFGSN